MIPRELFLLIFFICGGGMVLCSLYLGFRMGRQSKGIEYPGPAEPTQPGMDDDPYREAMPGQAEERIQTVDKQ